MRILKLGAVALALSMAHPALADNHEQMKQPEQQSTQQQPGKDLIGKMLYGANDEEVGEVQDVVMTDDGNLRSVLVDVGGFLGMGAKTIAISADEIEVGSDKVMAPSLTKESAKDMPEHTMN